MTTAAQLHRPSTKPEEPHCKQVFMLQVAVVEHAAVVLRIVEVLIIRSPVRHKHTPVHRHAPHAAHHHRRPRPPRRRRLRPHARGSRHRACAAGWDGHRHERPLWPGALHRHQHHARRQIWNTCAQMHFFSLHSVRASDTNYRSCACRGVQRRRGIAFGPDAAISILASPQVANASHCHGNTAWNTTGGHRWCEHSVLPTDPQGCIQLPGKPAAGSPRPPKTPSPIGAIVGSPSRLPPRSSPCGGCSSPGGPPCTALPSGTTGRFHGITHTLLHTARASSETCSSS